MSVAIIVSGWLLPAQTVHAAATATIGKDGYVYVPTSAGCPRFFRLCQMRGQIGSEGNGYYFTIPDGDNVNNYGASYEIKVTTNYVGFMWYTSSYSADNYNGYSTKQHFIYLDFSNPEVIGSNTRFKIAGELEIENSGSSHWLSGISVSYPSTYWDTFSNPSTKTVPYSVSINTNGSHSLTTKVSDATCTSPAVYKCSKCGARTTSGNALNHSWSYGGGSIYQNQTCTTTEIRYNKCTRCGTQSGTTKTKDALGHSWGEWTTTLEATPYATGSKKRICSRNSSHVETVTIPQMHFQIYHNGSRINKIYLGDTLIINASNGDDTLVK